MIIDNLMQVANQIESERGVSKQILFSAIEQALVSACKKKYDEQAKLEASLNYETGELTVFICKEVVEKVENEDLEISLEDAKKVNKDMELGSELRLIVPSDSLGRIAAQTAKHVIIQRIMEAEKESVYNEFKDKVGTILTGTIQSIDAKDCLVNIGRTESLLPAREQIPGDEFGIKDRIKVYVSGVEKTGKGTVVSISRTHPNLLSCLFELEIPEIKEKIIEIVSVAREPGNRSKVAVKSNNDSVGAVGTCVGQMGGRIQAVIKELKNEKIDVLEWSPDEKVFIANALKPAKISKVVILNKDERTSLVVVPSDQLSLAIGKKGINVRLSVKLTGWKIDILSEEEYASKGGVLDEGGASSGSLLDKIKRDKDRLENPSTENDLPNTVFGSALARAIQSAKDSDLKDSI